MLSRSFVHQKVVYEDENNTRKIKSISCNILQHYIVGYIWPEEKILQFLRTHIDNKYDNYLKSYYTKLYILVLLKRSPV